MKKHSTRFLCCLLLAVMLISTLASCGGESGKDTQSGEIGAETSGETETQEETPVLLPSDAWYDGYDFKVLVCGNFNNNDFLYTGGEKSDQVDQARYKRMAKIQEEHGIGITYEDKIKFGSSGGSGTGYQALSQSYMMGASDYDICMIGTYDVSVAAYSGYLTDLNSDEMKYVDLTKSWWSQTANRSLMIDGKMFYTTGDISLTDNIITNCIMFNKDLVRDTEGMRNPYDMVKNDEWNYDNFTSEVRKVSSDVNGDQMMTEKDKYGLLTWNDAILAAFSSANQSICRVENNEIELTVYTQQAVSLLNKYIDLISDTTSVYNYQVLSQGQWDPVRLEMFDDGRVAYYMNTFNTVPKHRDSQIDFGILPFPKLDETQENYSHLVSAYHCQFVCVPVVIEDADMVSGILEELAYLGKKMLTPAYYEKTLVGQYVRDEESVDMLDIIFASQQFDIGIYYKIGGLSDAILTLSKTRQNTFASLYDANKSAALTAIDTINERFRDVLGQE